MAPSRKRKRTTTQAQEEPTRPAPPPPELTTLTASTDEDSSTSDAPKSEADRSQSDRCHFFKLPGELRNEIYEYVAADAPAWLARQNKKRKLISLCPLAMVSKQVRAEFLKISTMFGPLATSVRNYNFSHLITFLNRLDESDLKRMETGDNKEAADREVRIHITFSDRPSLGQGNQLHRWLNRCREVQKKGSKIDFQYSCKAGEEAKVMGREVPYHGYGNPEYAGQAERLRVYGVEGEKMGKAIKEARTRRR